MYITGAIGSSGLLERFTVDYDLPNDRMYCESCASIGLMMFGRRMSAITRDASYYDAVELALCNTVLSGISSSGDSYFYVNPLEVWPENCKSSTSLSHVKPVRQKWFSVACCPTNIARTLASLGQYIYALDDDALYINQFISSEINTALGGGELNVYLNVDRQHGFDTALSVKYAGNAPAAVYIRIPPYARNPAFKKNGREFTPQMSKGYAKLPLMPKENAELTISAHAVPEFAAANINVRADAGKLALKYGPFVYCLEQQDNGENLSAISVSSDSSVKAGLPLASDLPTLELDGKRLVSSTADDGLYGEPSFKYKPVRLKAIPYFQWCSRTPGEMLVWMRSIQ